MILILDIISFAVSLLTFIYGTSHLLKKDIPLFFKMFVCASGCYFLEELWVVINLIFGCEAKDGLVTVRLFGLFGCFCFMLNAYSDGGKKLLNTEEPVLSRFCRKAFTAPVFMIVSYILYVVMTYGTIPLTAVVLGFISIAPALPVSYYALKYMLIKNENKTIKQTVWINLSTLVYCVSSYLYLFVYLYAPKAVTTAFDIVFSLLLTAVILAAERAVKKWKT